MSFETPAIWTDPAIELANLVHWLVQLDRTNISGHDVIANALELEVSSAAYHEAIASVVDRVETFHALIERLAKTSALLTAGTKAHLQIACMDLKSTLSPSNLARPWPDAAGVLPGDAAVRFEFGSAIVMQYVRLKIYPEAARLQKIQELEEALRALDEPPGPQNWQEMALRQGMTRLVVMLRAFTFFGHTAVENEARTVGFAAHNAALQAQSNGDDRAGTFKTVAVAAAAIMLATGALNQFDETMTSLGHLSQWASGQDPYGIIGVTAALPAPNK